MLKVIGNEAAKDEVDGRSLLDEIAREGARRMLVAALETEVAAYLEAHRDERAAAGHALVVRNGKGRTRKVTVGAGTIPVNLQHPLGREFLERWHAAAVEGVPFRGVREAVRDDEERRDIKWNRGRRISSDPRVRGHRHDQTVAGILAHRLGMRPRATGLDTQSRRSPRLRLTTVIAVDREAGEGELRSVARLRRYKYLGWLAQAAMADSAPTPRWVHNAATMAR